MSCPLCKKRKAKRFCPAKAQTICTVCCGTEREVTIDCPSDCPYLVASRAYDYERKPIDWSKAPFPDIKIEPGFLTEHMRLVNTLAYSVCVYALEHRVVVDSDVVAALGAMAETYRTLARGVYYENPPVPPYQRGLYEALKMAIERQKQDETRQAGLSSTRDKDIRDALVFLTKLTWAHENGRPKSRAALDLLRSQFKAEAFPRTSSNLVLP